jgi:hypothetical protein
MLDEMRVNDEQLDISDIRQLESTDEIARRFRERPENAILVLTKDYDELEFVMLERVSSREARVVVPRSNRPSVRSR